MEIKELKPRKALNKQNSTAEISDPETQINQLVYQLYDLTAEEIKIIEGD